MRLFGHKPHPNEFTVIGAFVVAGFLSLVVGGSALLLLSKGNVLPAFTPEAEQRRAPTVEEYRAEARTVLSPFLEQALQMSTLDIEDGDQLVINLVEKTQDRMLTLVVPAEERETHLGFVLLLDQWKRALEGSRADIARVGTGTADMVDAHAWLLETEESR